MKKILSTLVLSILCAGVLSSCSFVSVNPEPYQKLDVNVEKYKDDIPDDYWTDIPAVAILDEETFVLLQGGSGSCPDVIDEVLYEENDNSILIVIEKRNPNMACTEDFQYNPQKITLLNTPPVDLSEGNLSFSLEPSYSSLGDTEIISLPTFQIGQLILPSWVEGR